MKIKNRIPESRPYRTFQLINYIFMTMVAFLCLVPMINVLSTSLSSSSAAAAGEIKLLPVGFNLYAYKFVASNTAFWHSMWISIERVIIGSIINVVLCIMTAYPLSKSSKEFKGRTIYTWYIFVTMLFGGGLIPGYLIVSWTHLLNTIWALIIPGAVSAWNVILMLNFFRQLPKELQEAACIDGAGQWTILWKVVVPISKPVIATIALFCMVGHWNDWFGGYLFMNSPKNYPLQTYLFSLLSMDPTKMPGIPQNVMNEISKVNGKTLRSAQIFLAAFPILCVYPFLQKYFTKGIVLGSVKG
ncbi:MAG TPA: carbohydrate ABC transporter permease [Clostridiaceae bacterium]